MKVTEIKTNPRNPRKIAPEALDKLKQSIERDPEFMRLRPIVVDESMMVLGGNMRLAAIKKLGMREVPDEWVVQAADLSEEQRRRFVLVDNLPMGEWEIDLLSQDWELPELEELGFSLDDLGIAPDFAPGTEDDQGRLDELQPKIVKCPHCGTEFDARES